MEDSLSSKNFISFLKQAEAKKKSQKNVLFFFFLNANMSLKVVFTVLLA